MPFIFYKIKINLIYASLIYTVTSKFYAENAETLPRAFLAGTLGESLSVIYIYIMFIGDESLGMLLKAVAHVFINLP